MILIISKVCSSCERLPNTATQWTTPKKHLLQASTKLHQVGSIKKSLGTKRMTNFVPIAQMMPASAKPSRQESHIRGSAAHGQWKVSMIAKLSLVFTKRLKSQKTLNPKKSLILILIILILILLLLLLLLIIIIIIILPHPKDPLKSGHAPPQHLEWNHSEKLVCPCPSLSKSQQIGKVGKVTIFIYVIFTISSQTACWPNSLRSVRSRVYLVQ